MPRKPSLLDEAHQRAKERYPNHGTDMVHYRQFWAYTAAYECAIGRVRLAGFRGAISLDTPEEVDFWRAFKLVAEERMGELGEVLSDRTAEQAEEFGKS